MGKRFKILGLVTIIYIISAHASNLELEITDEDSDIISKVDQDQEELQDVQSLSSKLLEDEKISEILVKLEKIERLLLEIKEDHSKKSLDDIDSEILSDQSVKSEYTKSLKLLQSGKYLKSELAFAKFISTYPQNNLIDKAFYWYAESFFQRKIYNKALSLYLKFYKNYPFSSKAADGLLRAAMCSFELGRIKDGHKLLDKLDSSFPQRSSESLDITKSLRKKFEA